MEAGDRGGDVERLGSGREDCGEGPAVDWGGEVGGLEKMELRHCWLQKKKKIVE